MCKGKGMNVLVMDVEGTDGRERGEDQVGKVCPDVNSMSLTLLPGFRTQICAILARFLGSPHCKLMGTPSRSLPRCQHGLVEDRIRGQPWPLRQEDA